VTLTYCLPFVHLLLLLRPLYGLADFEPGTDRPVAAAKKGKGPKKERKIALRDNFVDDDNDEAGLSPTNQYPDAIFFVCIVMAHCEGGDLQQRIRDALKRRDQRDAEEEIRKQGVAAGGGAGGRGRGVAPAPIGAGAAGLIGRGVVVGDPRRQSVGGRGRAPDIVRERGEFDEKIVVQWLHEIMEGLALIHGRR
jgi:hypothetical protein